MVTRPRVSVPITLAAITILSEAVGCGHTNKQACNGAPEPPKQEWVVDGEISAVVAVCGNIYVGGSFQSIGPPTGAAALVDATTGRRLPFPVVDGEVRAAADDGRGGWFIGGQLKTVAGKPCHSLAHVAHGTLDWCLLQHGEVSALARDRLNLFVAYSTNQSVAHLASFEIPTRHRRAWAPSLGTRRPSPCNPEEERCGPYSSVSALLARRGVVYIGGYFASVSGNPVHDLAAVDGATGRPMPFNAAPVTKTGKAGYVTALALAGNVLYVSGGFSRIGGVARKNIGAVDARTGAATAWAPRVVGSSAAGTAVSAIAVSRNRVALGGAFRSVNGIRRRGLAVVTASAARLVQTPSPPRRLQDVDVVLAADDANFYVSGAGDDGTGFGSSYTTAVDARTGASSTWNPSANGPVRAIVVSGTHVFLGGSFSSVNAVPRHGLAALDSSGRLFRVHPQLVVAHLDPVVTTLLASGKTLYVGGGFVRIDDQPRSQLAAFALPSLRLLPWHPRVGSEAIFEGITALAASGGAVYAAGDFDSVNGVKRDAGVAAVDSTSGKTMPLNPSPLEVGIPRALAVADDKVFVGGNPSTDALPFAALDNDHGEPVEWKAGLGFRTDVDEEVRALAIADGSLYASGSYLPNYGVARMDLDDGHPLPLSLHVASAFPDYALDAMVSDGRNLYVRLKSGRVAVIEGHSGHVRRWVRVCPSEDFDPTIAVTDSRMIVNCSAAGGGERLVVVPYGG